MVLRGGAGKRKGIGGVGEESGKSIGHGSGEKQKKKKQNVYKLNSFLLDRVLLLFIFLISHYII